MIVLFDGNSKHQVTFLEQFGEMWVCLNREVAMKRTYCIYEEAYIHINV